MRRLQTGFTLVELLVCIAIMALLFGIVLSAIAGVREKGRQAHCISNLRQIGQALAMYRQDYSDSVFFVPPPGRLAHLYPQYVKDPGIFACPNDNDPSLFTIVQGRKFRMSYGYDVLFSPIPEIEQPVSKYVWPYAYYRRGEEYPICWDIHHKVFHSDYILVLRLNGRVEGIRRTLKPGESSLDY